MTRFLAIWLAQTISVLGSQLSGFALGVWLFEQTGGVTMTSWAAAATWLPQILGAPLAGVVTDRFDRRLVLLAGHAGAGVCSMILLAIILLQGNIAAPLALGLLALSSTFRAVELPAFSAATTTLVPRAFLGRANGLVQLGAAIPQLVAPALAGVLLPRVGLSTILMVDVSTFAVAIVVLLLCRVPAPRGEATLARSVATEMQVSWAFIAERPGLAALLAYFGLLNFNLGMAQVALTPLVLGFADTAALGNTLSIAGLGMLVGSLLMVAWGGPKQRIHGVLAASLLQGLVLLLAGSSPSLTLIGAGAFGILFAIAISAACTQTIWQHKVPEAMQGRVFALRMLLVGLALPAAQLVAGPLLDRVFEPALQTGGALAAHLGPTLGIGPGRGAALLLVLLGVLTTAIAAGGWFVRSLVHVERDVPDAAL